MKATKVRNGGELRASAIEKLSEEELDALLDEEREGLSRTMLEKGECLVLLTALLNRRPEEPCKLRDRVDDGIGTVLARLLGGV